MSMKYKNVLGMELIDRKFRGVRKACCRLTFCILLSEKLAFPWFEGIPYPSKFKSGDVRVHRPQDNFVWIARKAGS